MVFLGLTIKSDKSFVIESDYGDMTHKRWSNSDEIILYTCMQNNPRKMTKTESDNKVVVLRNKTNEGYFVRDIPDNSILNHHHHHFLFLVM